MSTVNPVFSNHPERALVVARALGVVQGPTDDKGKWLQAFFALARPPTTDVLKVLKHGTDVVGVRVAVRYRVGPVCLALYVNVLRPGPGGIAAVAEEDVQALHASVRKAALYIPPHRHSTRGDRECRCRRLHAVAARVLPVLDWAGQRGRPDRAFPARPHGWYGVFTYATVLFVVKQHCPWLVKSARRLARQVAWRTAREALR